MTIARTILEQLGGNRFLAMTGARDLIAHEDGLSFRLPRGIAKNKCTHVRVHLTAADLYDVKFQIYSARRLELREIGTHEGVYAESLREIFTAETGLDCTL